MAKIIRWRDRLGFYCLGCKEKHFIKDGQWQFNEDFDKPTLSPSILVRGGHYVDNDKERCWCKYNAEQIEKGEESSGFSCFVCHSFINDGKIQYLSDCTHSLAGQTIDLLDISENGD